MDVFEKIKDFRDQAELKTELPSRESLEPNSDDESSSNSSSSSSDHNEETQDTPDTNLAPWRVGIKLSDSLDEADEDQDSDSQKSPETELNEAFDYYSDMFNQATSGNSDSDSDSDVDFVYYDEIDSPPPIIEVVFDETESRENLVSALSNKNSSHFNNGKSRVGKSVSFRNPISEVHNDQLEKSHTQRENPPDDMDEGISTPNVQSDNNESSSVEEIQEPAVETMHEISKRNTSSPIADSAPISLFDALASIPPSATEIPAAVEDLPVSPRARLSPKLKRSFKDQGSDEIAGLLKAAKKRNRPSIDQIFDTGLVTDPVVDNSDKISPTCTFDETMHSDEHQTDNINSISPDNSGVSNTVHSLAPSDITETVNGISPKQDFGDVIEEVKNVTANDFRPDVTLNDYDQRISNEPLDNIKSNPSKILAEVVSKAGAEIADVDDFDSTDLKQISQDIKDKAEDIKEKAGKVNDLEEKLFEAAEEASEELHDAGNKLLDATKEASSEVQERLEDAKEDLEEKLVETYEEGTRRFNNKFNNDSPFKAFILRALGVFVCCYTTPSSYMW